MTKVVTFGPATLHVPAGLVLVGEIGEDRRVATAQRRARGNGHPKPGQFRRVSTTLENGFGRRAGDFGAHQNRRDYRRKNGVVSANNPLGIYFTCRRGDDRRDPGHLYDYTSSRDPRIRALDRRAGLVFRRHPGTAMTAGEAHMKAVDGIVDALLNGGRAK